MAVLAAVAAVVAVAFLRLLAVALRATGVGAVSVLLLRRASKAFFAGEDVRRVLAVLVARAAVLVAEPLVVASWAESRAAAVLAAVELALMALWGLLLPYKESGPRAWACSS